LNTLTKFYSAGVEKLDLNTLTKFYSAGVDVRAAHVRAAGARLHGGHAGELSPPPVLPYRRVRTQGRGRVRIQVHCTSGPYC
jgi:hypothetical protein